MTDIRTEKIRLWLKNPPVMKFPVPTNLPRFSRKSFRNYEEMNAWKKEYLKKIAEQGGIRWKYKQEFQNMEDTKKQNPQKILILLAGQSNMAGRGYAGPDDLTAPPRVTYIRPDFKWAPAIEPITKDRSFIGTFNPDGSKVVSQDPFETVLPQNGQKVCGVGLGRTFGKLLAEAYPDSEAGLIPCAVGGTSIAAWMPGGADDWAPAEHPYDAAILRAKEAQKSGRIAAILWHQGENDANKQTPGYQEKLREAVMNFRKDLGLDDTVPFIAGDMASFYKEPLSLHIDIVDHALENLERELPFFRVVHTKDLNHRGDNLHYDTASLHELGARYYAVFRKYVTDHGIDLLK